MNTKHIAVGLFVRLSIIALLAAISSGAFYIITKDGDTQGPSVVKSPSSIEGEWVQDDDIENVFMEASIKDGSILVYIVTEDATNLYWSGTFPANLDPSKSFTAISQVDKEVTSVSLYGSQDDTKEFLYKDGIIKFKFSMMGSSSAIRLVKKE